MPKNIGWTKKQAEAIAKKHNKTHLDYHAVVKYTGDFAMGWVVLSEKKQPSQKS